MLSGIYQKFPVLLNSQTELKAINLLEDVVNNLEFINIFDQHAKLNNTVPDRFQGMDRYDARDKILKELKMTKIIISHDINILLEGVNKVAFVS